MDELKKIRDEIDTIDFQMAKLYEKRLQAVQKVIQYKKDHHLPVLDAAREQAILERNAGWVDAEFSQSYKNFQKHVMDESKRFQEKEIRE